MKDRSIDTILAECLDAIHSGELTPEACLKKYPEQREELAPLLELALRLESSPQIAPRPSFQRSARARILGQISAPKPVTLRERIQGIIRGFRPSLVSRPALIFALLLTIVTSLLFGGVAYASDGAIPGDAFYPIDRTLETVRLRLTTNSAAKAKFQLSLADERLQEAEILSVLGDGEKFDIAMRDYGQVISQVPHSIRTANPTSQSDLNTAYAQALAAHESQLKRIFTNLATPAIGGALSTPIDQNAMPSLSFEPDELELSSCSDTIQFIGHLNNTGDPPDDTAANVVLGYQVINGGEFVERIQLTPFYWEAIGAGEQVEFTVGVELIDSLTDFTEESEIKIRVFIASESNRPDHHVTRLTLTVVSSCGGGEDPPPPTSPTKTSLPTATPSPTSTVGPEATETQPPNDGSIVINENNRTRTIDCSGKAVQVIGNNNTLTLLGTCNSLSVSGNANHITLEHSTTVTDTGNQNVIVMPSVPTEPSQNTPTAPPQVTPTAPPPTQPAGSGPIVITDNNRTRTIDCSGNAVEVIGNNNTLTLLGTCNSLLVSGNTNHITLEYLTTVTDTGNENVIVMPSVPTEPPQNTPTVPPPTQPASSGAVIITENNQTLTIDCNSRPVEVLGDHNTLTLRGTCSSLLVRGDENYITLENSTSVANTGDGNTIVTPSAPTDPPQNSPTAPPPPPTSPPPTAQPTLTQPASSDPIRIAEDNQTLTIDCNGDAVEVLGDRNTLTLTGTCSSLLVRGDNNHITLEVPTDVTDTGDGNIIDNGN